MASNFCFDYVYIIDKNKNKAKRTVDCRLGDRSNTEVESRGEDETYFFFEIKFFQK